VLGLCPAGTGRSPVTTRKGNFDLEILIQGRDGGVGQRDQFSQRIIFLAKRSFGFWVDDGEHIAADNSPDQQAVTFDRDHPVFLVED